MEPSTTNTYCPLYFSSALCLFSSTWWPKAYVLEGYPEVWINGYLWKLEPGDSVGFPAGTGICHTFLNNTEQEVRLLVVGEANKKYNRIYYPLNPGYAATRQDRWVDHPPQFFGPHDGKPRKK